MQYFRCQVSGRTVDGVNFRGRITRRKVIPRGRKEGSSFRVACHDPSFDDAWEAFANDGDVEDGTLKYEENKKERLNDVLSLPRQRGGWNENGMIAATDMPRVVKSIPWF